jgi:hypothetical protein
MLKLILYIKSNRRNQFDSNTFLSAAKGRHLKILKWILQNGYPWDKKNCRFEIFDVICVALTRIDF